MQKKILIGLAYLVGIALVLLVIVKVIITLRAKAVKRKLDQQIAQTPPPPATDPTDPVPAMDPLAKNYSTENYKAMANALDVAMRGVGTDEDLVVKVFKYLKSDGDFNALNSAFGNRDGWSMRRWLKGDLSQWWIDKINKDLRRQGVSKQI